MKKTLSFLLLMLMSMMLFSASVLAEDKPYAMDIFMTISDESGKIVLAKEPVNVTDTDGDGILTIHDALMAAHNTHCKDGYATYNLFGDLLITRLWGVENAAYDCFNNGSKVWRLNEYLADGDHIQAYVYTDSENMSDMFSYFSKDTLTFEKGKASLTLYAYTLTEENNLLSRPAAGAIITVNGEDTDIKTDKNGKFTISVDDLLPGEKNVISARSEKQTIVPPILVVTPDAADAEDMGQSPLLILVIVMVALTVGVFAVRFLMKKAKK